jgi:dTDP-4-dehydrorhamnose reductase
VSQKNKKIVIIGSSGLVGGNLLAFSSRYPFLTTPTFHHFIPDTFQKTGLHLDITNPNSLREVLETVQPDCVVNLSCMEVVRCEKEPDRAHQLQVMGVKDLAGVCNEYNIRLIHLSTDMVYSGEKGSPYTLKDEPDPVSVYGRTKLINPISMDSIVPPVPLQRDLRLDNSKIKEVVCRERFTDIDDYFLRGLKSENGVRHE